jgi:hypothetical protein
MAAQQAGPQQAGIFPPCPWPHSRPGPSSNDASGPKRADTGSKKAMTTEPNAPSYQLILIRPDREEVLFTSPNRLDVELEREKHIRSITTGFVEIREA